VNFLKNFMSGLLKFVFTYPVETLVRLN